MVANTTVDVLGALAKLELWRVNPDHDQAERRVIAIPGPDIRQGTDPVDAGVCQTSTSTTLPRSPSGVSGAEFTHRCALSAGSRLAAPDRHEPATMLATRRGRMVRIKGTPSIATLCDQRASTSMIATANACGASCGRLCPIPPVHAINALVDESQASSRAAGAGANSATMSQVQSNAAAHVRQRSARTHRAAAAAAAAVPERRCVASESSPG